VEGDGCVGILKMCLNINSVHPIGTVSVKINFMVIPTIIIMIIIMNMVICNTPNDER
jgi:hypothetical protein